MKTRDEIYAELKADFETASGLVLSEGGDMSLRFSALAAQLYTLYCEAEYVLTQTVPQTATGENLDAFAALRGLERAKAKKASGTLRFTAAEGTVARISTNVRCRGDNGEEYVTTAAAKTDLVTGYCDVPAEAVRAGASGNAAADAVNIMMLAPLGAVSCTNPSPFIGGADAEDDASLRDRVLKSYAMKINGGNKAYYKALAMSTADVAAAQVIPKKRGAGTVDVVIATHEGTAPSALISQVQSLMNENREVCVDVLVKAPTSVSVNVTATVKVKSGYSEPAVIEKVKSAINAYFCGELLGKNVLRAELGALIYSVDGVENYTLIQPTSDTETESDELPTIGTLSVSGA